MRLRIGGDRAARLASAALAVTCLAASTGCATLRATLDGYRSGPGGISRPQHRLRQALVHDDFVTALGWRENDALLQALTTATAAYHAGQFARSAALLDSAALLADDRITTSLSRTGVSLLTNDLARPYEPGRTERLFIPYYALLAYAQVGTWEDAAVEARRVLALRDQYAGDRDPGERSLHALVTHLAGAALERAGDVEGARAAYRAGEALDSAFASPPRARRAPDEGELLVIVERGFVAHRVTRAVRLCLGEPCEGDGSWRHGAGGRAGDGVELASLIRSDRHDTTRADVARYVTIAYPELRRAPPASDVLAVVVGDAPPLPAASASVDDAADADARRERTAVAARGAARAVAKAAVTQLIADKKGELAGDIASAGAALLERSDVRSWHLLPQRVALVRVRVRAGTQTVRLAVGTVPAARMVDLGTVTVKPGALTIVTKRLWSLEPPPPPLRTALAARDSTARRTASPGEAP